MIRSGTEMRTRPRWLTTSGPRQFSAAVVAALDEASQALRSPGTRALGLTMSGRRSSLTAGAQQALTQIGAALVPSTFGAVDVELDPGRFTASGWRRLPPSLSDQLPTFASS